MRCLIVYESMYGNTRDVALAIAEGAGTVVPTDVVEVGEAPTVIPDDVGLLVVGGPTHAFSMSRPSTRADATTKYAEGFDGDVISTDTGIREWLGSMTARKGLGFATFDTRVATPHLPGSAAAKAAKILRKKKLTAVTDPESFWVEGTQGPLSDGDLERAERWGAKIAEAVD